MNTSNIKSYAPQARNDFMQAVAERLNLLGIAADNKGELFISEVVIDGSVMQIAGNSFDASLAESRKKLVEHTQRQGFNQFVEHTAYTWFNRFCAIRYMELHDYLEHGLRVLSHPDKNEGFEILDHAQDVAQDLGLNRDHIVELKLAGNKDEQLYRELLLGQCHKLHQAMPFLFEALDDETELLLPDNLTRTDTLLRSLVNDIPEQDWQQVEIIGWLYQFYISEKKDQVIGKVIKSEDIPAATQLFTPNWIVKYLVQNSVGRKWCQTYPDSTIKSEMEYYIEPAKQTDEVNAQLKATTPDSIDPETIKVLDPACGSGHILVEAYNVLKSIYEERGYRSRDIPKLILENNVFGIDIDDRAAQLAGFTLMMLARADDRRIFTRDVSLNVLSLQETKQQDLNFIWRDLEIDNAEQHELVQDIWRRFEHAKTFGSLIDVPVKHEPALKALLSSITEIERTGSFLQRPAAQDLLPIIQQALILAQKYDAVVANPPYMGSKGMNAELKKMTKDNYPNSKADLFAVFIERGFKWLNQAGFNSMVTMHTWMFLSSYEQMRENILGAHTIETMTHMGNGVMKIAFGTNATVFRKSHMSGYEGFFSYIKHNNVNQNGVPKQFPVQNDRLKVIAADDFKKIPGSPIAYWASKKIFKLFSETGKLNELSDLRSGISTGDNDRFYREWYEVSNIKTNFKPHTIDGGKWFPIVRGGDFRRWYGNKESVINLENKGYEIRNSGNNYRLRSEPYYTKTGITWSRITAGTLSFRLKTEDVNFGENSPTLFSDSNTYKLLALLNSKVSAYFLSLVSPTLSNQVMDIGKIPILVGQDELESNVKELINKQKSDWDMLETSWDFQKNPLTCMQCESNNLRLAYDNRQVENLKIITDMQYLEQQNNRLIIEAYDLDDELAPDVPLEKITLTVNPRYRYGGDLSDEALEIRFQSDTLAELISYAIGCMMGRYSLDREGLVYAHSGNEGFAELEQQGAYNTFPADDDGIIPLTDQEWFADDTTNRFREFIRVVWGEKNLQQNLDFVAESLCLHALKAKSGDSSLDTIRRYLSNQFYKNHLKTYKKRPIYWLFSSGKQKAFECLVYLHRYNQGTLARMRTEYVTPLLGKYDATADLLNSQIEQASSTAEANRLSKSLTALEKKQTELREFDDKLKHHADMQINLDLDDGVKVNYGKFGDLLVDVKAITGKK